MSNYASRVTVGRDWIGPGTGRIADYPENDLRKPDRKGWPQGAIHTAHIPHWCVPGHDEDDGCPEDNDAPVGEWLRLSVASAGAWLDVLADRDAVEALRDDLTAWLDLDHVPARNRKATK